jgi:cobaltochelatase CobT
MRKIVTALRAWFGGSSNPAQSSPDYRVFTRDYDRVVGARELDSVLGPLEDSANAALGESWTAFGEALQGWRTKIAIEALEASGWIRSASGAAELANTSVTLLIDQSGSMRGQNMLLAAATGDIAADFLHRLGCKVEVLGFTTVGWHGGQSRKRWRSMGEPPSPGRLCDLLHIIYVTPNDPGHGTGSWAFRSMLRPDLPKENVDGEALTWAASRLRVQRSKRKILVVISDGAPVDDATLAANDPGILDRHLKEVIADLQESQDIELAALGISFDVGRYYSRSATVATPSDLGAALITLLESLLSDPTRRR